MSRGIAVHVIGGNLFIGVGTPDAQESIPRPALFLAGGLVYTGGR